MKPPDNVIVWVCKSCGHWCANSYFDRNPSNPDWQPRCKTKDGCKRPEMTPAQYSLSFWAYDPVIEAVATSG